SFDNLMARWFPLTYVLNSLNRSLGMPDGYPFALAPPVIDKLRFVHRVISAAAAASGSAASQPA
ncbi:putative zinc-binding metallopeptidase, partial [Achromobacter sp. SIMBA_011]